MGVTSLIDDYYFSEGLSSTPSDASRFCIGQLGYLPVIERDGAPYILDAMRENPRGHYAVDAEVRRLKEDDFRQKQVLPVKLLGMSAHHRALIYRAKKRLGIIIAIKRKIDEQIAPHIRQTTLLVIPSYHVQKYEDDNGVPPELFAQVKALRYPWFFPLKEQKGKPYIQESMLRVDQITPVVPGTAASFDPLPLALRDEPLTLLLEQMRQVLGMPPSDNYLAFKQLAELCL